MNPLRYALGGGASLALHGGAALALMAMVGPEPVPQQPLPEQRIDLQTAALERRDAAPREAESAEAESVVPDGTRLAGQGIARREAVARAPTATQAALSEPQGAVLAAAPPQGAVLAVPPPQGEVLAPASPQGKAMTAAAPQGEPVAAAAPQSSAVAATAAPGASVAAQLPAPVALAAAVPPVATAPAARVTQPRSQAIDPVPQIAPVAAPSSAPALAASATSGPLQAAFRPERAIAAEAEAPTARASETAPPSTLAAQAAAQGASVALLAPPANAARIGALPDTVIGAAMDWSGAGEMLLDPGSLTTLQAFLAPDTAGAAGAEVRDGIAGAMAATECARVQTAFDPETGTLELRGTVPNDAARAPLTDALRAEVGAALPIRDATQVLGPPQCGVLAALDALGLPNSEEEDADELSVGPSVYALELEFRVGAQMGIALEAPDYPAFVYVDYYDSEGNVIHLSPNQWVPLRQYAPAEVYRVGGGVGGLSLQVEPPLGQDIAVAIATERPLFDAERPVIEPAGPYLEELRAAVAAQGEMRAEWVYLLIETLP